MKKITQLLLVFLIVTGNIFAQQEKGIIGYNNWMNPWTEFRPNKVTYDKPTQILSGDITRDTKLYKRDIYLLLGDVFVSDSATLTIEPGTIIIGDFNSKGSLTISKGSKIIANGSSTDPIIFTSSRSIKKPGDWGGIFILGDAPTSKFDGEASLSFGLKPSAAKNISYGGDNLDSYSGILSYVRIEFAGKRTKKYGNFNGLTLAGVGQKTTIDNVMVSYCKGNSFNVLGGNVNLDKLVSFRSNIHDFEFNYGVQCTISNSLAVRSPYVSGAEVSKCLNILAYDLQEEADFSKLQSSVYAENLTLINVSNDLNYDMKVGLVNEAIFIGENSSFSISSSVISGFNPAAILDDKIDLNAENLEDIRFTSTYFNNCNGNIFKKGFSNNDDLENWYGSRAFNNVYSKGPDYETFIDSENTRRPDFRLRINKIIASNE
ncbi:MAG: hypothetical protein KJP20_10015 [Bacteroidia bacterium]|nr:hypothetical protein [Bacteroidia bacterium]MBT8393511.1 hypothetical protein [Bacteroidia bacterium]